MGETHLSQGIQQSRPFAIKPVITSKMGPTERETKRVAGNGGEEEGGFAAALAFGDWCMVDLLSAHLFFCSLRSCMDLIF